MNLGFKIKFPWGALTNFEQKILSGEKNHSIREDPKRRWKVGIKIHMATGIRTKNYRCFCDKFVCKSIQEIRIFYGPFTDEVTVLIDGKEFYHRVGIYVVKSKDMIKLAKNDGFDCVGDFFKWFNKDFSGVIIHWTDLKY